MLRSIKVLRTLLQASVIRIVRWIGVRYTQCLLHSTIDTVTAVQKHTANLPERMSTTADIPVVDFSSLSLNQTDDELDENKMKMTVSEMMNAFSTTGFVYLSNTHFPQQLVRQTVYYIVSVYYTSPWMLTMLTTLFTCCYRILVTFDQFT